MTRTTGTRCKGGLIHLKTAQAGSCSDQVSYALDSVHVIAHELAQQVPSHPSSNLHTGAHDNTSISALFELTTLARPSARSKSTMRRRSLRFATQRL